MGELFPLYVEPEATRAYIIALLYRGMALEAHMAYASRCLNPDNRAVVEPEFRRLADKVKETYVMIGTYAAHSPITTETLNALEAMINDDLGIPNLVSEGE